MTGDGDALSIGGNHLIHALRRNVNLTILLFNNQIYGLTKGQYSPTSEIGKVTKSTPFGSLDTPFNPVTLALGAEATFVARTHDMDRKHMMETFRRAHDHRGRVVRRGLPELQRLQRRRVRADHRARTHRADMLIPLEHGEPIRFGADGENGVVLDGRGACASSRWPTSARTRSSSTTSAGRTRAWPSRSRRLATGPYEPTPIGVFRAVERPDYGSLVDAQLAEAQAAQRAPGDLAALLRSGATWTYDVSARGFRTRTERKTMPVRGFGSKNVRLRRHAVPAAGDALRSCCTVAGRRRNAASARPSRDRRAPPVPRRAGR